MPKPSSGAGWKAEAIEEWTAFGVSGGWLAAAVAASATHSISPVARLESLSLSFLKPPQVGTVDLEVRPLRVGTRAFHQVQASQEEICAVGLGVVVAAGATLSVDHSVAPIVSDPELCPTLREVAPAAADLAPPIFTRLDLRPTTWSTSWPPKLGRVPRAAYWVRLAEELPACGVDQLLALIAGDTVAWLSARAGSEELSMSTPRTTQLSAAFTSARAEEWLLVSGESVQSEKHVTSAINVFNRDRELLSCITVSNAYRTWESVSGQ